MKTQYENLRMVIEKHFKGIGNFAKKIGVSQQSINVYKNRDFFGELMMTRFEKLGINPGYIRTGEGPMLLNAYDIENNQYKVMEPQAEYNIKPIEIPDLIDLENITIAEMRIIKNKLIDIITEIEKHISVAEWKLNQKVNEKST